ncbi:hydroxyacid dehydrogenase, partial [Rhizobiaceae sp. 2RAB30]
MSVTDLPLVISAPAPRSLALIFSGTARAKLHRTYAVAEADPAAIGALDPAQLAAARYIVGQPPLSAETLSRKTSLRANFKVESNLLDNMPYETLVQRGFLFLKTVAE